jgi:hypothetical protein
MFPSGPYIIPLISETKLQSPYITTGKQIILFFQSALFLMADGKITDYDLNGRKDFRNLMCPFLTISILMI